MFMRRCKVFAACALLIAIAQSYQPSRAETFFPAHGPWHDPDIWLSATGSPGPPRSGDDVSVLPKLRRISEWEKPADAAVGSRGTSMGEGSGRPWEAPNESLQPGRHVSAIRRPASNSLSGGVRSGLRPNML